MIAGLIVRLVWPVVHEVDMTRASIALATRNTYQAWGI